MNSTLMDSTEAVRTVRTVGTVGTVGVAPTRPALPDRWVGPRRSMPSTVLIACVVLVCALLGLAGAPSASAHPLSTTAVLLDVGAGEVTGKVQLPIDRLAIALDESLTAESVLEPAVLQE